LSAVQRFAWECVTRQGKSQRRSHTGCKQIEGLVPEKDSTARRIRLLGRLLFIQDAHKGRMRPLEGLAGITSAGGSSSEKDAAAGSTHPRSWPPTRSRRWVARLVVPLLYTAYSIYCGCSCNSIGFWNSLQLPELNALSIPQVPLPAPSSKRRVLPADILYWAPPAAFVEWQITPSGSISLHGCVPFSRQNSIRVMRQLLQVLERCKLCTNPVNTITEAML